MFVCVCVCVGACARARVCKPPRVKSIYNLFILQATAWCFYHFEIKWAPCGPQWVIAVDMSIFFIVCRHTLGMFRLFSRKLNLTRPSFHLLDPSYTIAETNTLFTVIRFYGYLTFQTDDEVLVRSFPLQNLLPTSRTYYRYSGSLTTPPCSECVTWNIFAEPLYITKYQVDSILFIYLFIYLFGSNQGELLRLNNGYHGRTYVDWKYEPMTAQYKWKIKHKSKGLNWLVS